MNAVTKVNPVAEVTGMLNDREGEFKAALPAHIPVERFMRVVLTAIQTTPALASVERRSLFTSAIKAAQDGLLPDGREAALVIYRDKNRGEIAQYMPMIAGIRKKVRNSGEIATWDAQCVHEGDAFDYELGDEPFIRHKPALGERGKVVAAYSIAVLKSGEKSREVMSISEIEAIRKRSRAAEKGPWVTDYAEMCRKTVARRHSKVLPMSTDLDDLIRRDDDLYDMQGASDKQVAATERPRGLSARLDALGGPDPAHDAETGEIIDNEIASATAGNEASANGPKVPPQGGKDAPPIQQARSGNDVQPASSSANGEPQQEPVREKRMRQEVGRGEAPASTHEAKQSIVDEFREAVDAARSLDVLRDIRSDFDSAIDAATDAERDAMRKIFADAKVRLAPKPNEDAAPQPVADPLAVAYQRGRQAKRDGHSLRAIPPEYRELGFEQHVAEWRRGFEDQADEAKSKDGWSP